MKKPNYIVTYYEGSLPQYFICFADNGEHAKEQCRNAYPDSAVVEFSKLQWEGPSPKDIEAAYDRFFGL